MKPSKLIQIETGQKIREGFFEFLFLWGVAPHPRILESKNELARAYKLIHPSYSWKEIQIGNKETLEIETRRKALALRAM